MEDCGLAESISRGKIKCKKDYKYSRERCRPNVENFIIRSSNWIISDITVKGRGILLQPSAVIFDEVECCFHINCMPSCRKESITDVFSKPRKTFGQSVTFPLTLQKRVMR